MTSDIIKKAFNNKVPFKEVEIFSALPGIYFIYNNGKTFPSADFENIIKRNGLINVGKTDKKKIINQHFKQMSILRKR